VGRSKNLERSEGFFGWGTDGNTAPHPDRYALRPPHKGEVR
jgi:hypothetical protein